MPFFNAFTFSAAVNILKLRQDKRAPPPKITPSILRHCHFLLQWVRLCLAIITHKIKDKIPSMSTFLKPNRDAPLTTQHRRRGVRLLWRRLLGFLVLLAAGLWWFVQSKPAPDITTDTQTKAYLPVVYDVATWQGQTQLEAPLGDVAALLSTIGASASQGEYLDIDGIAATQYRFHAPHEPVIYAVDSPNYLELAWYFASAKDSDADKAASIRYANKAFALSSRILGEQDARALFVAMLEDGQADEAGDPDTPKRIAPSLPQGVRLAKCQAYQCQLVFKK